VNSLLSCHDSRLEQQPNAVVSHGDFVSQMTTLTLMRIIAHHHFDHTLNHGPFFCLTDGHASNILVDKDGKIPYMLELEYGAFLPADFVM
jgi:hypothetical protein